MKTLLFVVAGCLGVAAPVVAADAWVTIASDPPGASIYWMSPGPIDPHELAFGPAPQRIKVDVPKGGCVDTHALRVRWVSGVEASLPTVRVCQRGQSREPLTFIRPSGVPGLETDARYALDLARLDQAERAIKQRHKDASERTAIAALGVLLPPVAITPTVRCTSELVGTSVYTTCR
jgi:hypothetical protein